MRPTLAFAAICLAAMTPAQYAGAKRAPAEWKKGFDTIVESDAKYLLGALAGPDFRGRGIQGIDFAAAAGFCVAWFRQHGVAPAGKDGSYFQRFDVEKITMSPESNLTVGALKLEWAKDVQFSTYQPAAATAEFAFVRLAKDAKFADIDLSLLKGKTVLSHPNNSTVAKDAATQLSAWASDPANGVKGYAIATSLPLTGLPITTTGPSGIPGTNGAPFQTLRITIEAAGRLAEALGVPGFATGEGALVAVGNAPVAINAKSTREVLYSSMNVVGRIVGSDPVLKNQTVLIGSHLDHLGVNAKGTFWGADDNGSGVTANLLIARAVALNPVRPKRSVIFALWAGEESGLYGSRYYAANPLAPLADTIACVNMDMLGRNADTPNVGELPENNTDAVYAGIAKLNSPDLYRLVQDANRFVALNLRDDKEDRTRRSDTAPFAAAGIPTLKAFTGEHKDYHQMTDTLEKINWPKLTAITRWLYLSVSQLSAQTARPAFVAGARYLRGKVSYLAKVALLPTSVVELRLMDGQTELDRTVIRKPGQVPVFFTLVYRPAEIKAGGPYRVEAVIRDGKRVLFQNLNFAVFGSGQATEGLEVVVSPV